MFQVKRIDIIRKAHSEMRTLNMRLNVSRNAACDLASGHLIADHDVAVRHDFAQGVLPPDVLEVLHLQHVFVRQ